MTSKHYVSKMCREFYLVYILYEYRYNVSFSNELTGCLIVLPSISATKPLAHDRHSLFAISLPSEHKLPLSIKTKGTLNLLRVDRTIPHVSPTNILRFRNLRKSSRLMSDWIKTDPLL